MSAAAAEQDNGTGGEAGDQSDARADAFEGADFATIERAVMETAQGRWFLEEYARRLRQVESGRIEAALGRIETGIAAAAPPPPPAPDETQTRLVTLSVHRRLMDLARSLRDSGVADETCARIEAQANALLDVARRRAAADEPVAREPGARA